MVRPAGRTHLEVPGDLPEVLYGPDRGNRCPNAKVWSMLTHLRDHASRGVRRKAESEGRRRQIAGPTNSKRIRGSHVA